MGRAKAEVGRVVFVGPQIAPPTPDAVLAAWAAQHEPSAKRIGLQAATHVGRPWSVALPELELHARAMSESENPEGRGALT